MTTYHAPCSLAGLPPPDIDQLIPTFAMFGTSGGSRRGSPHHSPHLGPRQNKHLPDIGKIDGRDVTGSDSEEGSEVSNTR